MIEQPNHNRDPGDEQPELSADLRFPPHLQLDRFEKLLHPKIFEAARDHTQGDVLQRHGDFLLIELPTKYDIIDLQSWITAAAGYQLDFEASNDSVGVIFKFKFNPRSLNWIDALTPAEIGCDYTDSDESRFARRINVFCQLYCLDDLRMKGG